MNPAVHQAIRQPYYAPVRQPQIIGPPPAVLYVAPPVIALIQPATTHAYREVEPALHPSLDHHDPVVLTTDLGFVGVFLVVLIIGFTRVIVRVVLRPL